MTSSLLSRRGILAGGNWIIDHVKIIDTWPPQDALATILSQTSSNGGSPYNLLKNLAKLGASFPLAGIGLVGEDGDGERILNDCRGHGIDVAHVRKTSQSSTSYTDVMTEQSTGRRTFFHQRGANAFLGPEHFDFSATSAKIFHLGYLLLLDRLDANDGSAPRALEVLARARTAGLLTSVDCVSENSDRFSTIVLPVLREVDVLFANDFEAEHLTGLSLRSGGSIADTAVENAARRLIESGVRQWVVIHFPEAVFALGADGQSYWQPSVNLPAADVVGTAGAGDAFAAGVLYGLHEEWSMPESLRLGVCAAASSLYSASCSDSVSTASTCSELGRRHGFRTLTAQTRFSNS